MQDNAVTPAVATSVPGTWKNNCVWNIAGVGNFTSRLYVSKSNWTAANFDSSTTNLRHFIKNASSETDEFPNSDPSRIVISGGNLLLQNDGQTNVTTSTRVFSPGAMINTAWNDIKYGSVRTVAKGTINPGSVYGMYFYSLNPPIHGETDIELRTSYPYQAWYTNQESLPSVEVVANSTLQSGTIADAFHEYRLDWLPGGTVFYIDGIKVASHTSYVPGAGGNWAWNAWR